MQILPTQSSTLSRLPHIPELDGIRGVAILLVLLCHSGAILKDIPAARFVSFGLVGVDLFFVLSGLLITGILLNARETAGYYRGFYTRRALRIWPLYFAYLAAMAAIFFFVHRSIAPGSALDAMFTWRTPWPLYLIFCQNLFWPTVFGFVDFVSITWSLCIEEHFYLLWAPTVKRLSLRGLRSVLVAVLIASPFLRIAAWLLLRGGPYQVFYESVLRFTPLHLDAISAGCLLALLRHSKPDLKPFRKLFAALLLFGLAASIVTFSMPNGFLFAGCFSALAAMFTGLTGLALTGWNSAFFRLPALRSTGRIGYGLYLINPIVFNVCQSHTLYARLGLMRHLLLAEVAATVLAFAISFALAALSWRFFESRFLAFGKSLVAARP
jgi:peptidoglycan/LPS O-acetylase OafA/YrhL